jgi:photosystem II stability/assembly factor-like uncharacterized protein
VNLAVASDGTLYAGSSDGQIFVSADRGDSWRALHPPVPAGLAAVDPRDPSRVYAESADADGSHLLLSEDGGTTWRTLGTTSYPIFSLVFDPAFRNVLYGINLFGRAVVRSVDGGASWETAGFAGPEGFLTLKVVAGADALYVPTDAGVYRSEDRGTTWAPFGDCLASPKVFYVAVDDRSGVLYAATNGGVFQIPVPAAGRGRVNPVPGVSAGSIRRTGSE